MARLMFDSVNPASIPAGSTMVAGYVNGAYANLPGLRARFPHALMVGISVTAGADEGVVLDVETGDAAPAEAPGWVLKRRAAGVDPTVYCNASTWPAVRAAFAAAGVAAPNYWIADYDGDPAVPAGAVAKQYASNDSYDTSAVAAYWPGVDPVPQPPEDIVTPQDIADLAAAVWSHPLADPFRLDAAGHPAQTAAGEYLVYGDSHFDRLTAQNNALAAQVKALSAQVTALSAALAAVAKDEVTAAEIQAAVTAALAAAGQLTGPVSVPAPAPASVPAPAPATG